MSKLVWDRTGEKYYENGVNHGVLYVQSSDGTYPTGVVWNGLTTVSESPDGAEPNDIWADNIKYGSLRSAETFGGTIEAYTYPDEWAACDGSASVADGVTIGQQSRSTFGLAYRTEIGSDTNPEAGYKLHLVYGATASPSERSYETINDSPDAMTMSWEFDTIPVEVSTDDDEPNYKPTSLITIDSTKTTSEKMKAIEAILYGTDGAEGAQGTTARLPLPAEVITLMS